MSAKVLCLVAPLLLTGLVSPLAQESESAVVAVAAPVRVKPNETWTPLATLKRDTRVRVLARDGDWYRISFRDLQWGERVGFMKAEHLRFAATAETQARPGEPPPPAGSRPAPARGLAGTSDTNPAVRSPVSETMVATAIAAGLKGKGHLHGVRLGDSAQQWTAVLTKDGAISTAGVNFSVHVYTPTAWIRALAARAASDNRAFTRADLDAEAVAEVFRVIAIPDVSDSSAAGGASSLSLVRHVILRDEARRLVIEPIETRPLSDTIANVTGVSAGSHGLEATFPLDAVRRLRGPLADREFFITVIGSGGEEKSFRVKKEHFDQLR